MWKNHGDLTFDYESDPSKVNAQCVKFQSYIPQSSTGTAIT